MRVPFLYGARKTFEHFVSIRRKLFCIWVKNVFENCANTKKSRLSSLATLTTYFVLSYITTWIKNHIKALKNILSANSYLCETQRSSNQYSIQENKTAVWHLFKSTLKRIFPDMIGILSTEFHKKIISILP